MADVFLSYAHEDIGIAEKSDSAAHIDNDEDLDLSERLRRSLVYSAVKGNRYHTE